MTLTDTGTRRKRQCNELTNKRISADRIATIPVSMRREKNTERSAHEHARQVARPDFSPRSPALRRSRSHVRNGIHRGNRGRKFRRIRERNSVRGCARQGFFKEEGANVTGIITSAGGGTSLRMPAGGVPYGEVNPGVVVAAVQRGTTLRTDLRQCPHGGGIRLGGAPGFSNQIDRRHNVDAT
jgi:hypothetical protein